MNLAGRERWSAFAAELEEVTGLPTGYRDSGASCSPPTVTTPRRSAACTTSRSLGLSRNGSRLRAAALLEPGLAAHRRGILAPQDGHADPCAQR